MTSPLLLLDGKPIRLGERIGRGGEGEVFALGDGSGRAVKLYSAADTQRESKIAAMVRLRLAERSSLVAFPIGVIRGGSGRFAGFVMNLVREHKPLHELYSPGARKQNFPEADYRFLVRAALNTARAVASVHDAGCVIGDINHSGVLVSKKATVALIDADSFQVIDGSQRYLCRVGVPEYTPPELQGLNLGTVVRMPNHDAFGLAIVIFQLLAMGRHPFVGAYAKGDLPLERAIAESRFAYSKERNVGLTPPPGTVSLDDFLPAVARAFEAAFSPAQQASRPTAAQWVTLLGEYERSLRVCSATKLHYYSSAAPGCPWCRMEGRLGVVLFVPTFTSYIGPMPAVDPGSGGFNLVKVWARIESIRLPDRSRITPTLPPQTPQASAEARAAKAKRDGFIAGSYLAFTAAAVILLTAPKFFLFSIGLVALGFVLRSRRVDGSALRHKFLATESQWDAALQDWEKRCGIDRIGALKASLVEARANYQGLGKEEADRLAQYQAQRRERQFRDYLDGFLIRRVKIHGIGPAKQATLASYGIETAADVDQARVLAVPGFGLVNSRPLLEWRREIERRFTYNSQPNAADQVAIGKIRSDVVQEAARLRHQLSSGAKELWQAVQACEQMLKVPDPLLAKLDATRAQIKADFAYLSIPLPHRPTPIRRSTPPAPLVRNPQTINSTAPSPTRTSPRTSSNLMSCPICGSQMVRRTAKRGRRIGRRFWGCSRYPTCVGTRP
jgi:DNA-binding helix-hairpin-helix protein with protein kinase domain